MLNEKTKQKKQNKTRQNKQNNNNKPQALTPAKIAMSSYVSERHETNFCPAISFSINNGYFINIVAQATLESPNLHLYIFNNINTRWFMNDLCIVFVTG